MDNLNKVLGTTNNLDDLLNPKQNPNLEDVLNGKISSMVNN